MAYESIKVDIIPGAENAEVLHFSQYDNKRTFFIELFNGGAEFIPEAGMTLSLECRKRDGNIVIISNYTLTDNVAEFSTTEQLTACYGDNMAEIKIVDNNDLVIGSANFIINVEKSPTCGGLVSESEIDNLTQQIEDIAQEVIGDDYYNKTQTDALLADKADKSELPDMTDYYTKTQTDNLLYHKADQSELSNYYKKTEVDNLLNAKVDKTTLQSDYYDADYIQTYFARRTFVENYVDATATASGNPCTFDTAKYHTIIPALTASIVCGGGGGTPSVPIPLVPHSEINLDVNGDTFTVAFGQTVYGGVYDKSGRLTITHVGIDLGTLDYSLIPNGNGAYFYGGLGANPLSVANANCLCSIYESTTAWYIMNTSIDNAVGVEDTYLTIRNSAYNDASAFKTAMSGIMLAYELATPIVIDVPSISVSAENGTNNIVSDGGGDVNVSYKDTIQHYIDSRI